MDTDFHAIEDLLDIARVILGEVRIRDIGLLESAAARPMTTVFGDLAYPTFELQAAALMHSLSRNHSLVDGNKRLAWSAMRVFFLLNDRDLRYSVDEAEQFVLAVAKGDADVSEIAAWLTAHQVNNGAR